jgi:hypothetical protein
MRVPVPRTTLVCVDCQYPRLALRALRLSLAQCAYPAAKFFTDALHLAPEVGAGIELVPVARVASARDYSRFVLKDLLAHITTDFVQIVQWDGYVINGAAWTEEFQRYDYIGARWWFREDGRNVGNGGFSLRSRRLLLALQDPEIGVDLPEDNAICLEYRGLLESRYGIRVAPAGLADRYAFEGTPPTMREFGFHRLFNFPLLYRQAALAEILEEIPDGDFCAGVSVSLVHRLADLGRVAEALRYAGRIRRVPAWRERLDPQTRAEFEQIVRGMAPAHAPCPCGSGTLFAQCCGAL